MAALENKRPQVSTTRSFSRYEPSQSQSPARSRASTLGNEVLSPVREPRTAKPLPQDVYEKGGTGDNNAMAADVPALQKPSALLATSGSLPEDFDELPIELISLSDRFITSLTTAKVYPTPPSIDTLSELFQDFYRQAEGHIATHIQALASRQQREASPAPSVSSRTSATSKRLISLTSKTSRESLRQADKSPSQQMLTPSEISERRRARRLLELKRVALEESVERRVCEGIYDKIWRHKSSLDEVKDEKLRSKTAALALVGITMDDLGIQLDRAADIDGSAREHEEKIEDWISRAREGLLAMNDSHCPLGKLQSLISTHQNIVDFLSSVRKKSSSADEILPTLIYTLITCPWEGINIISNLNFVQRFRSANKIDGEAAYCLTNLEAAVTFLETVDLATLRSEEAIDSTLTRTQSQTSLSEPAKSSPALERPSIAKTASPITTPLTAVPQRLAQPLGPINLPPPTPSEARPSSPSSPSHQRRLSTLLQPSANALGAASDAVRSSADQSFRNISTTLDNSFKLLFGRLREQQAHQQSHANSTTTANGTSKGSHEGSSSSTDTTTILLPKTLDEARRLVSPKLALDEDGTLSEASSFAEPDAEHRDSSPLPPQPPSSSLPLPREERLLDLITGRAAPRDRSADSAASTGSSGRRMGTIDPTTQKPGTDAASTGIASPSPPVGSTSSGPLSAVESMRSLGTTLNPLNRLPSGLGASMMRGFGRSAGSSPALTPSPLAGTGKEGEGKQLGSAMEAADQGADERARQGEGLEDEVGVVGKKTEPPPPLVQRFVEMEDAGELRVGEVAELLRAYQRLARAVRGKALC